VVIPHTAWYVGGAPAVFTIAAIDNFGNAHTDGGHASAFAVATNPLTIDETGWSPGPVGIVDNDDGTYRVLLTTVRAGLFRLTVTANGAPLLDGPFALTVLADRLAANTTTEWPERAVAGARTELRITPRDRWGNVILFGDQSDAFTVRYLVDGAPYAAPRPPSAEP